jgi:hypothetical protein
LSVVEVALEAAPEMIEKHGKMHLGEENGMKVADLRRVWKQLDAVGDAEFVTVESEQESVRIARRGDIVEIRVNEKKGAAPSVEAKAESAKTRHAHGDVRVEVPVSVVDALLSGEGEELDVKAAVAELQKRRGDIVRVVDQDSQVRIWIDEQNTQPAAR